MNLIQEAMKREESDDVKPKKRASKNPRVRTMTTIVTWILLNVIWMFAVSTPSTHYVMDHDTKFDTSHRLEAPNLMNIGSNVPVTLTCEFKPTENIGATAWIEITLKHNDIDTTLWEGNVTDDCPAIKLELAPGTYYFISTVFNESRGDVFHHPNIPISGKMNLDMYLWEAHTIGGYVVLNILGLVLFVSEKAIRHWASLKRKRRDENIPLHKRRQREEWEQVMGSMSGGDAVDIEDLDIQRNEPIEDGMESKRRRMREQFAAQAANADGDIDEYEDDTVEHDDELGEGTTEGLTGEVKEDRNIRTVGDIWRRLSSREDKKKGKR
ncbi:MAG: hypothetical protein QGF94_02005 [Candidatus Thalassarchaeaceae archaeon]|nr:hypothetical protein [Candidatus Thalassarchaeaceae archaeon]